jgi:hypothetical protein
LVGLLLGFSFVITSSRFNERSRLVNDEANAIGTCYLRAGLLAEPANSQIRTSLRRYTDFRLTSFERGIDPREFERLADSMHATLRRAVGRRNPGGKREPRARDRESNRTGRK